MCSITKILRGLLAVAFAIGFAYAATAGTISVQVEDRPAVATAAPAVSYVTVGEVQQNYPANYQQAQLPAEGSKRVGFIKRLRNKWAAKNAEKSQMKAMAPVAEPEREGFIKRFKSKRVAKRAKKGGVEPRVLVEVG